MQLVFCCYSDIFNFRHLRKFVVLRYNETHQIKMKTKYWEND